ncbi:MAG: hypothetical protein JST30_14530 [Armatimonadetes bacterium]|nr:hypothetical protein [Armatimonadota bacterium]
MRVSCAVTSLAVAAMLPTSGQAELRFRVVDLGPGISFRETGTRVNSAGWVLTARPWVWRPASAWNKTPTLSRIFEARPMDLNDSGGMAVHLQSSVGGHRTGTFDPAGRFREIDMLPGFKYRTTNGINVHGDVVGTCVSWPENRGHGWLYRPGVGTIDLGESPDGPGTNAVDINDNGDVVGVHFETDSTGDRYVPHLWLGGVVYVNLGRYQGKDLYPTAMNIHGDICGTSSFLDAPQLRLADGTYIRFGPIPGKFDFCGARDMNDDRWVVGSGSYQGQDRSFLWRPGYGHAVLEDLVDWTGAGYTFLSAWGVSNNGKICGQAKKEGETKIRPFLLEPYYD